MALSLLFLLFSLSLSAFLSLSTPLSTVSITHGTNYTLICAVIPSTDGGSPSIANCTRFPGGPQDFISNTTASVSAVLGGDGFVCGLIPGSTGSSSNDTLRCWRFSPSGAVIMQRRRSGLVMPFQRVFNGPPIRELESGASNFCGILSGTGRIECWPSRTFDPPTDRNFSSIALGSDFLCGLTVGGAIECFGPNSTIPVPSGNFTVVAAGLRHACGIRREGGVACWGEPMVGTVPVGEFKSLALGDGRSCALRINGSVVCWGHDSNFSLPGNLLPTEFIEIQAKRNVFCGIVAVNFSLVCWGNGNLDPNRMVFNRVLPGQCTNEQCRCGVILGSGNLCNAAGATRICLPCVPQRGPDSEGNPPGSSPTTPTEPESSSGGGNKSRRVAYLVVGIVGTAFGVGTIACFFFFRVCKVRGCRVHDSGRLDEEAVPQPQPHPPARLPSHGAAARLDSMQPQLDKRLSKLISMGKGGNLQEFSLEMLIQITNNFSEVHKIGSGSFGSVYHATLDDGREVAIKRAELTIQSSYYAAGGIGIGTKRQEKDYAFLSELALLSRLNHKNLVQLIGYCDEGHEQVLVYEFMPNGSLHDHLHKLESSPLMSWTNRLEVALDAARGVEYLHTYAVPPIIHRDIKSSNILLDATWMAKVSDFGLSLMGPEDESSHISLRAAGTVGYMDPEYYRLQQLTTKSDVYSFGVVLLELLTGYKAIHRQEDGGGPRNVVDFAVPYIVTDEIHHILDSKLPPPTPNEIEAVVYVGYLAADCVSLEGQNRPSMTEIVNYLEKALAAASMVQPSSMSRSTTQSST